MTDFAPDKAACPASAPTPIFPRFKALETSDRTALEAFTNVFEPYSDFCFSTLLLYDRDHRTRWCWLNGNLVLRLHDGFGPGEYLTFLGRHQAAATASTLIEYAYQAGCSPTLERVPEPTAQAIAHGNGGLLVEEDRAVFDYVYNLALLTSLQTTAPSKLRRDVRRFRRRHPDHHLVRLDLGDVAVLTQLRHSASVWMSRKNSSPTAQSYCHALERCLGHAQHFDLVSAGVVIGDLLAGFAIAKRISGDWLLSHFVVSDPQFPGLAGCLLHHMTQLGSALGCTLLNDQEDLGDPGLRHFKMKCAPSRFLRKFKVRQLRTEL